MEEFLLFTIPSTTSSFSKFIVINASVRTLRFITFINKPLSDYDQSKYIFSFIYLP